MDEAIEKAGLFTRVREMRERREGGRKGGREGGREGVVGGVVGDPCHKCMHTVLLL